ncbi:hypothetical protein ES707_19369 [subsurface metagenome]
MVTRLLNAISPWTLYSPHIKQSKPSPVDVSSSRATASIGRMSIVTPISSHMSAIILTMSTQTVFAASIGSISVKPSGYSSAIICFAFTGSYSYSSWVDAGSSSNGVKMSGSFELTGQLWRSASSHALSARVSRSVAIIKARRTFSSSTISELRILNVRRWHQLPIAFSIAKSGLVSLKVASYRKETGDKNPPIKSIFPVRRAAIWVDSSGMMEMTSSSINGMSYSSPSMVVVSQ